MNNQKKEVDEVPKLYSVFILSLKPKRVIVNKRTIDFLKKGTGVKTFRNIYVKFKDDCVELSDWEDFRRFMYVPYSEVLQMNWEE